MSRFVYELGFDWNMPDSESSLGVIFPLHMALVKKAQATGEEDKLIWPCHGSQVKTTDTLAFRILDFTGSPSAPAGTEPRALQVLFTPAARDTEEGPAPFSPILDAQNLQVPILATTDFHLESANALSAAYGAVERSWSVAWDVRASPHQSWLLSNVGRFELRALLTVAAPDEMARFYRVDPEMVVDDGGP